MQKQNSIVVKSEKYVIESAEVCPFCGAKHWYPWAVEEEKTVKTHLVESRGAAKKKFVVRDETLTEIVEIVDNMVACYNAVVPNVDLFDTPSTQSGSLYVDECACCGATVSAIV